MFAMSWFLIRGGYFFTNIRLFRFCRAPGRIHAGALFRLLCALATAAVALGPRSSPASSSSSAPRPQCIVGDPKIIRLNTILSSDDQSTLMLWRAERAVEKAEREPEPNACDSPEIRWRLIGPSTWRKFDSLFRAALKPLKKKFQSSAKELPSNPPLEAPPRTRRHIRRACIEESIKRIPDIAGVRANCTSERGNFGSERLLKATPCLTDLYVDFVHWAVNRVLDCVSQASDPIDPQMIFRKINNESAFGSFMASVNGKGLTQLVSISINETLKPRHSGHEYLKRLMSDNQERCGDLSPLLEGNLSPKGEVSTPTCRVTAPGDGVVRNLLLGIGLFSYYRKGMRNSAEDRLKELGLAKSPEFRRMRDLFALVMFNRGPADADKDLRKVRDQLLKLLRNKKAGVMTFEEFKGVLSKQAKYIRDMDQKMRHAGLARFGVVGDNQLEEVDCTEEVPER